jgi:hypothetical protein
VASAPAVRPAHPRRQPPRPYARGNGCGHSRRDSARHGRSRRRWGLSPAGQSLLLIVAARFVQRLIDLIEGGYRIGSRMRGRIARETPPPPGPRSGDRRWRAEQSADPTHARAAAGTPTLLHQPSRWVTLIVVGAAASAAATAHATVQRRGPPPRAGGLGTRRRLGTAHPCPACG